LNAPTALGYRLTLVQSGITTCCDYGKSTALATLDHGGPPVF
jgi:hypothetical protein